MKDGLPFRAVVAAVGLDRAESRIYEPINELAERSIIEFQRTWMGKRDECPCGNRHLNAHLRFDLAAGHVGSAAVSNQPVKRVAGVPTGADRDEFGCNVGAADSSLGPSADGIPCDHDALLLESLNHQFGPIRALIPLLGDPRRELGRHRIGQPGKQVALPACELRGYLNTGLDVDAVCLARQLRLGNSLERVVIGQCENEDAALSGQRDDACRCQMTIRDSRMAMEIDGGVLDLSILLGSAESDSAYDVVMANDVPTGRRVRVAMGTSGSLMVFRNAKQVHEGVDFDVLEGDLVFREPLHVGRKTGFFGRLQMTTAGIGVYEKIDSIDIHVTGEDGSFRLYSDLHAERD